MADLKGLQELHEKHGGSSTAQNRQTQRFFNKQRSHIDSNNVRPFTKQLSLDFPEQAKGVQATYTTDPIEAEAWLRNNVIDTNQTVLGFDIEWKPQFIKKKHGGEENRTAVLQLSTAASCLVLHIIHVNKKLPRHLADVLGNEDIYKVGCGIRSDISKLLRDTGLVCKGAVDLAELAKKVGYGRQHDMGLKTLSKNLLEMEINKPKRVQLSNWESFPLNTRQICYASLDAWVGIKLYLHMKQKDKGECSAILLAPQLEPPCVCKVCGKKCKGNVALQEHLSQAGHTSCTRCGKVFVKHVSIKHDRQCVALSKIWEAREVLFQQSEIK